MLNSPDAERYELSSWKSCLSGAAPFPVANLLAFQKRFHCTVFEAYGLSEASPAVKDAVAIGVPDPVMEEEIKVYAVLKEGMTAEAEEILNYCQNQLAKYKWPKFIEFTKSLPRNPMGKILRKELRKLNNRDS